MGSVRENAAEALGLLRDRIAVDPLIDALNDEDVSWKSALALGNIWDKRAIELLIPALQDKHWPVRRFAVSALGKIGDRTSVMSLINALNDSDWHVRKYAADALGKIGDETAIKPLVSALSDFDGDRWKAIIALGNMKNATVEPLINTFKSDDWRIRGRAVEALGNIWDIRGFEPLINALIGKNKDMNKYVRGRIAEALGKIGDERAVEPLIAAMEDPYIYVRIKAEEALNKMDSARWIKNFDNSEISFNHPSTWEIIPIYNKRKIVKGHSNSGITFSINKNTDLGDLTSKEFACIIKDVFIIQNNEIISETDFTVDNVEVYIINGEDTSSEPVTKIMIAAFKLEDYLYYLWFAGGEEAFEEEDADIKLIIDSFKIYI